MKMEDDPMEAADHLSAGELSRLADGEPLAAERARHLDSCPACAGELAAWRALSRGARGLGNVPMPLGLETRVLAALRDPEAGELPGWLAWWGRPWGLVTAALLLLAATLGAPRWLAPEQSLPVDWAWAAGLPAAPSPADPATEDELMLDALGDDAGEPASPAGEAR